MSVEWNTMPPDLSPELEGLYLFWIPPNDIVLSHVLPGQPTPVGAAAWARVQIPTCLTTRSWREGMTFTVPMDRLRVHGDPVRGVIFQPGGYGRMTALGDSDTLIKVVPKGTEQEAREPAKPIRRRVRL